MKLIESNKENNRFNMVFEYIEAESILNYMKNNNEINETFIKNFNKILYDEIFQFNESNLLPFIFISIHNFLINKESCPIVFDFGIHKLLISQEEYSSYFLPNTSEMNNINQQRIKTNVMNYGITLLKIFSGNKVNIKGKEIVLTDDKILSDEFKTFMAKCLARNFSKRAFWSDLQKCSFISDIITNSPNVSNGKPLIDDEKLNKIFGYLTKKFEIIIKYYSQLDFKNTNFLSQIETFVCATLFEMRIIDSFFNRNIDIKPFTNQQEISFISINSGGEMNKCDLNFVNPILKDVELIKMQNNEIIKKFVINLQKYIKNMETIVWKIQSNIDNSICSKDYQYFIEQIINNISGVNGVNMHQYFSSLVTNSGKEKNEEIKYNESYIAKCIMEFIIYIIIIINDNGNKINFNKDILLKKFYKIFGEEKNIIEISTINLKDNKPHYLLVSFLPVLFKFRDTDFLNKIRLLKDRQSINGLIKYYPSLMDRINKMSTNNK